MQIHWSYNGPGQKKKKIVAERHVQEFLHRGAVQDVGMSFLDESFLELFLEWNIALFFDKLCCNNWIELFEQTLETVILSPRLL